MPTLRILTTQDICAEELIQFAGDIQPNGFMLCVDQKWRVVRASENVALFLIVPHERIVGQPLAGVIDGDLVHDIRGCLQSAGSAGVVGRLFGRKVLSSSPAYDIAAHRSAGEFIIEFEPTTGESGNSLSDLRSMISSVERQGSSQNLLEMAARHVRAYTGFDRVMIYRFDEDDAGEVVAESAQGALEPYLGLRFPASDIPAQARALYARSYLRIISDVDAVSVPVTPGVPSGHGALDLSMSSLRSVSPVHLEYLRNMGVRASMSVSILRAGRLWGLFACHHGAPRRIGYEMRSIVELFGQMFSYLLEEHEREDNAVFEVFTADTCGKLKDDFTAIEEIQHRLPQFWANTSELVPCDGIAVVVDEHVTLAGQAPAGVDVLALVRHIEAGGRGIGFTRIASSVFPPASLYATRSAGFLVFAVSKKPSVHLAFFRREIVEHVVWAGEPEKSVVEGGGVRRLSPRRSFAAWRETVRGQSARWTESEQRAADTLRATLRELPLQASHGAHVDRAADGRRQEIVIAELNHRVRNILGLVRGLITQSAASAQDVRALVESLDDRIRSLASAHDILTNANWTPSSLHALLRAEMSAFSRSEEDLVLIGPDVMLQPGAYTAIAMVVHELVTNARKHGALTTDGGHVIVETAPTETDGARISWQEAEGPPVRPPTRRGFGSTILEQAIPFECGGTSVVSYPPNGFRLVLTLPGQNAVCVADAPEAGQERDRRSIGAAELHGTIRTTLIVEDNLFIAIDAEDMLRTLGAGTIEVVKTVAEALEAIELRRFTFALLDVNLGEHTSLPVALALRAKAIPFVFGTGYGQALGMPASLKDTAIVSKPYNRYVMARTIAGLLYDGNPMRSSEASSTPRSALGKTIVAGPILEISDVLPIEAPSYVQPSSTSTQYKSGGIALDPDALASNQSTVFLRKLEALAKLTSEDREALRRAITRIRLVARRTDVVREDDRPTGLHVVIAGFACRFNLRADGSRQITSFLVPGDFCDLSVFPGQMTDTLGTLSDCRIATVSQEIVMALRSNSPRISVALARSSYVDQATARQWLMNLGRRTSDERFAHLFCELLTRLRMVGLVERDEFRMPLTQFDLGDTLGLSYVHVNRTMQSLRQRGLVSFKGRLLSVLDLSKLKKLAEFSPGYLRFVEA